MGILERFMAYAQDFERTYHDDDWSRLAQYFAPDATYEVRNIPAPCVLRGQEEIFRGIKKSLDGFDRKLEREIGVVAPPTVDGDTLTLRWRATYTKPGAPPLTTHGCSVARYAGDVIVSLIDTFEADPAVTAWLEAQGRGLRLAYV
jgi:hypothetical protein